MLPSPGQRVRSRLLRWDSTAVCGRMTDGERSCCRCWN